jgi:hypothetical protein
VATRREDALSSGFGPSHLAGSARILAVALLLDLLVAPGAVLAASPAGSEFQVNTATSSDQVDASVASDSTGKFVVVWTTLGYPAYSIHGQRYSASGSAIGGQFQVNTYTTALQGHPSIASDSAGDFVVVWQSAGSPGSDDNGYSVQGRRYAADGSPIGGQFQVNTYTTNGQASPSVASDSAGGFVVVWESFGGAGGDTSESSVQGQRFGANGAALGGEFQVNTYSSGSQDHARVASDSTGNFAVVWQSEGSSGSDTSGLSVLGQRYAANGSPVGGEFQVNSYTTGHQTTPAVARDGTGKTTVVWNSFGSPVGASAWSIQGQRYDASGVALGGQFQVGTYAGAGQFYPSIASDSAGDFVVVWESDGSAGSDTSWLSVQGRSYSASGSPIGAEFQVNTYTTGYQAFPAVASNSAGDKFVVAWQSDGSAGGDASGYSIQGQRYLPEPALAPGLAAMIAMLVALRRSARRRRLRDD